LCKFRDLHDIYYGIYLTIMCGDRLHDPITKEKNTYNTATREHANANLLVQLCNQIIGFYQLSW